MSPATQATNDPRVQLRNILRANPEKVGPLFFGVNPWRRQNEIIQSVFKYKRTAVPAGHSVGKTFTLALTVLTFLLLMPDSIVITTAPTFRQVKELLWREIHRMYGLAGDRGRPLGGVMLDIKYMLDKTRFAIGFATDKQGEGVKFQGWHSPNLLIVFDEAAGIEREIWDSAEGALASEGARILCAGNPYSQATKFFEACTSGTWNVIPISSLESPNVIAGKEIVPGLATREWCDDMAKQYGTNSANYQFRVLGQFPDDTTDTLIALSWCKSAQTRAPMISDEVDEDGKPKVINVGGVDVARFGADQTIAMSFTGNHINEVKKLSKRDTVFVSGCVAEMYERNKWQAVAVDDTGVGGGVTDQLQARGMNVLPVNFGGRAYDDIHYHNTVAEMFSWLADDLKNERISGFPVGDDTMKQLVTRKYKFTPTGHIKLESKDDYKERMGNSPDEGDALLLANHARRIASSSTSHLAQVFV